jgi:hypothetical protein
MSGVIRNWRGAITRRRRKMPIRPEKRMATQARKSATKKTAGKSAKKSAKKAAGNSAASARTLARPAKAAAKKTVRKTTARAIAKKVPAKKAATGKTAPRKAVAKKAVAKKAVAKKAVAKKAVAKKVVAKKAVAKKAVAKKAVAKKVVAKKVVAKKVVKVTGKVAATRTATKQAPATQSAMATRSPARGAAGASKRKPRGNTPEQALANTRALLEAKQAHDRETPPWQSLETQGGQPPQPGFQSDEARIRADELHAGESRRQAIQGSIGSQDRHQQGKRDAR